MNLPTIKQILFTADGISEKAMTLPSDGNVEGEAMKTQSKVDLSKATPRPWRVWGYQNKSAIISVENEDYDFVVECHSAMGGEVEDKANAALICEAVNAYNPERDKAFEAKR